MKKFLLASLVVVLGATTMQAATTANNEMNHSVTVYAELSTICKMIQAGEYDAVKAFIDNGTDINRKSMGMTPAMYAARYNRVEILKLLIQNGAKLKLKSSNGFTALDYAKMSKAKEAYAVIEKALQ